MATAPFQLWIDGPAVATAIRVGSTVTITTSSSHGVTTGAWVQTQGFIGAAGTSMNGVYQITTTSGSAFTYTAAGSAGTAVTAASLTSEAFSYDRNNPNAGHNYHDGPARTKFDVPTELLDGSAAK